MDELVGRVPPADWVEAAEREAEEEHFAAIEEFDADLAVRDRLWEKGGLSQAENAAMLRVHDGDVSLTGGERGV